MDIYTFIKVSKLLDIKDKQKLNKIIKKKIWKYFSIYI